MKKCLIVGGTGFLGRWLIQDLLLTTDYTIVVYSRNSSEKLARFGYETERIHAVDGCFDQDADFFSLVENCDVVFHLVSTTVPGSCNISICDDICQNTFPTVKLLDSCVEANVGRFVYFSSGGTVYGTQKEGERIVESSATNPICSYGIQKLMNEKIIQMYGAKRGLNYLIVRLSNPYGPYQNPDGRQGAIAAFTWRILNDIPITIFGDGENVRDYIDVRDTITMLLRILSSPNAGTLYNVGSGVGTSLNQIITIVERATGKKAQVIRGAARAVDVRTNILSIDRYLKEISSEHPRKLEDGISDLINYYTNGSDVK